MTTVVLTETAYEQVLRVRVMPVLGAARYADGSYVVVLQHTSTSVVPYGVSGPVAFRTTRYAPDWVRVWAAPAAWLEFITSKPVGTSDKVSNRRMTVVDVVEAVPDGAMLVAETGWYSY